MMGMNPMPMMARQAEMSLMGGMGGIVDFEALTYATQELVALVGGRCWLSSC